VHRSMTTAIEAGLSFEECRVFLNEIQSQAPASWRFVTLLRLAELFPSAITDEAVGEAYAAAKTVPDRTLAYAWFMYRQGKSVEALQLVQQLEYTRIELSGDGERWFYSDVAYNVRLRWLQELLGIRESDLPAVTEETEARARVERAARELGQLRAMVMKGQTPSDLESRFRSLLLFHNRPVRFSAVGSNEGYILGV
jgi:hypothetical protein